ncbi:MAG: 50S ribosomal protein L29 [Chloroflexi bacterium]|jgi:large subunit ribosomal protein L29|nr:50S ribosomal protein L29 [Chloroflexota bacterium]MCL0055107.1 50S ribosomal protein L29 [Dehalococcoidia bacterium]MDP7626327.1 50S ribosomal protein L29 [SAR202 cluster bacterium]PKB64551.1 MAG: 50S ribosomal protein L29 [SAR202 cluster bacterium Io17-Chloro-G3]MBG91608.1 50S ribosomal protein L29 [Chloroflexota bacterium]|tara:strand:+ start:191 stop:397 length:207 start_codon:yes stop_codon:yes gene_type:complete
MAEIDDIRLMNDEDLSDEFESTQKELMNLRFRSATMQLVNVNEIRLAKKKIARIKTVTREREIVKSSL